MAGKRYIVTTLSLGGLNNQIFKSGEKVSESDFAPGEAEKNENDGGLKLVSSSEKIEDRIASIDNAKTIEAVNEIMSDGEKRVTAVRAYKAKIKELENAATEKIEGDNIEAINSIEVVKDLQVYVEGDYSQKVKNAATEKIESVYVDLISKLEDVEDLKVYLDGEYSEDVKAAAKIRQEDLQRPGAEEGAEEGAEDTK